MNKKILTKYLDIAFKYIFRPFIWVYICVNLLQGTYLEDSNSRAKKYFESGIRIKTEDIESFNNYLNNSQSNNSEVMNYLKKLEGEKKGYETKLELVKETSKQKALSEAPYIVSFLLLVILFYRFIQRKLGKIPQFTSKDAILLLIFAIPIFTAISFEVSNVSGAWKERKLYLYKDRVKNAPPPEEIAKTVDR
jgi:uncharacterized protein YqhQ